MFRKFLVSEKALVKLQIVIIIAVVCITVVGVSAWWVTRRGLAPTFWPGENAKGKNIEIIADG